MYEKKLLCWLKAQINYDLLLLKGFTQKLLGFMNLNF